MSVLSKTLHQSQIRHWVLSVIYAYDQKIILNYLSNFHVLSLKGNAFQWLHPYKRQKFPFIE